MGEKAITNTLTISRELAERFISDSSDAEGAGEVVIQRSDWEELRAILAAPVVERQEPVAWVDPYAIKRLKSSQGCSGLVRAAISDVLDARNGYTQPLYTSPPAPVAEVVANWSDWSMVSVRAGGVVRTYVEACKQEPPAQVAVPEGWKLVPIEPTETMLNVLHDRVLISVNSRKKEANILNDRAWWKAVVESAPACLDKVKEMNQ